MKFWKRLTALLLSAACLCALIVAAPANAATAVSTFKDITDPTVGEAVEVLRTMGLIDGVGQGRYLPNDPLTRAQFCKLVITVMGREDKVADYTSRTIFPDVASTHWARGYVNLAASEDGGRLVTGRGDGTFGPDVPISFGEAVTLLLRLLGYTKEANSNWPRGAITTAEKIGLTEGMPKLDSRTDISRGAGAILFRNLLTVCPKDSKDPYVSTLGQVEEDMILLSCNTTTADGRTGAVLLFSGKTGATAGGAVLAAAKTPADFLQGRLGSAVFDKDGLFLTFLPDHSASSRTLVTSKATAGSTCVITGVDGGTLTVTPSTSVWYQGEKKEYRDVYNSLNRVGVTVTAYFTAAGTVDYLYVGGGAAQSGSGSSMVVRDTGTGDPFTVLTGGASGYTIIKNGTTVDLSHIRQYDVATFDPSANALFVTDFRLTGVYASASPSVAFPSKLSLMGKEFEVLDSAVDDLKQFKLGSSITLLFTADGKVAGVEDPSTVRSTAVGIVESGSGSNVTVKVLDAPTKELETFSGTISGDVTNYRTSLVSLTGLANTGLRLTRLTSRSTADSLNVTARTLGSTPLAENVHVFERIGGGELYESSLSAVTTRTVAASKILYQRQNYAGAVDLLILNDVTGDGYTYGIAKNGQVSAGNFDGSEFYNRTTIVSNSASDNALTTVGGASYRDGQFIGLAKSLDELNDLPRTAGSMALNAVQNAVRSDFDLSSGYFSRGGVTLPIWDGVQCYNATAKTWFSGTGEEALNACLAYADSFTVYYDRTASEGGKVRIIVVK